MVIFKRVFDIAFSLGAIVAFSPLLLLIAIAVKLDSAGPVIFAQERVGFGFRRFRIYKFRTMIVDAESRGPGITARGDDRITRIGRIFRMTKVDELPQLFNVLRGDMSIVGPRPELPLYVSRFADDYAQILSVRPGLTDPASIHFVDEEKLLGGSAEPEKTYLTEILPKKIRLAKQYVRDQSLSYDFALIATTITRVIGCKRASVF